MKFRVFAIPIFNPGASTDELNQFLADHRVLRIDRQLVADGQNSVWTICVSFEDPPSPARGSTASTGKGAKVDYRQVLSEAEFSAYARLRALRKERSEREGVPPYALFNNEQLAEMVRRRIDSVAQLAEIPGVGPARATKYGEAFLAALREAQGVSSSTPPAPTEKA